VPETRPSAATTGAAVPDDWRDAFAPLAEAAPPSHTSEAFRLDATSKIVARVKTDTVEQWPTHIAEP